MKLVLISDTHNLHRHLDLPGNSVPWGDVLIHAGDMTTHGSESELINFLEWFDHQPHKYKICIAGNHDWCLELHHARNMDKPVLNKDMVFRPYNSVMYLEHHSVDIDGVKFYGHPYTPWHHGMAFNKHHGQELATEHAKIPTDTDVLITHGPPHDILDKSPKDEKLGSVSLRREILNRIHPKLHVFGHVHEDYGQIHVRDIDTSGEHVENNDMLDTLFVNAAIHTWLWKNTEPTPPIVITL